MTIQLANVLAVPHVVDGDTAWVQLEFIAGRTLDNREIIERDYVGGSKFRFTRDGITLNTPEKPKKADPDYFIRVFDWEAARNDAVTWIQAAIEQSEYPITAEIFGTEKSNKDSFGRYLGDLIYGPASLVRHMRNMGWSAWNG